jgi:hypothetical protein
MRELFIEELEEVVGGATETARCRCCLATTLACGEEGVCSSC